MSALEALYGRLPLWGQHSAVTAYGLYWRWLRFGPGFARHAREYAEREQFDRAEWRTWQNERLRRLLRAAATSVPYYQRTWSRRQQAAAIAGHLEELPLLEKDPVRAEPEAFTRTDSQSWPRLTFHTSGSTGMPVASLWTIDEVRNSMALREIRSAGWAGVSFRMARATFSGRLVEPRPQSHGPFYRYNLAERQVYLSPFHLRRENAAAYVAALWRHRVRWLTGYAVSYFLLAKFILEEKLKVPPLQAVITTSEKLTHEMRGMMEDAYACRVWEEYSTVENALFASECRNGGLHVSPDAAVVEILRPDGTPCEAGETGEIVATGLIREYQPFIRYRLGDLAQWGAEPCSCGLFMPVLNEVMGRIEDVITGPDGRQMVRFHGIFAQQPHVREGQIIQETPNRIRVKVVPSPHFGQKDIREIVQRVQQRLGNQVDVVVEPIDAIPRTRAGKFPAVISLLHQSAAPPTS